jgi:hypothetical protein
VADPPAERPAATPAAGSDAARKIVDGGVASSATPTNGAQRADDNDERVTRPAAVAVKITQVRDAPGLVGLEELVARRARALLPLRHGGGTARL